MGKRHWQFKERKRHEEERDSRGGGSASGVRGGNGAGGNLATAVCVACVYGGRIGGQQRVHADQHSRARIPQPDAERREGASRRRLRDWRLQVRLVLESTCRSTGEECACMQECHNARDNENRRPVRPMRLTYQIRCRGAYRRGRRRLCARREIAAPLRQSRTRFRVRGAERERRRGNLQM